MAGGGAGVSRRCGPLPGRSVFERYWDRHVQAARRHVEAHQPRVAVFDLVREAFDRCQPIPDPADHVLSEHESLPQAQAAPADAGQMAERLGEGLAEGLVPDSVQAAMDAELRVVEAVERVKAALDAQALTALARMRSSAQALVAAQSVAASKVPVVPDELVTLEIATATGLGQREIGVRLELAAAAAARFGRLRELLATGLVSLRRACEVVEATRHLVDDELVDMLVAAVFAPTRDGAGLSAGLFRQRLRRAVLRADADAAAAAARRRAARRRNGAHAQVFDDGTGQLTIRNDAEKVAAAMDRADAAARAAKAAGDPRSLDQFRADFLTGAAIFGQPPSSCCGSGSCHGAACGAASDDDCPRCASSSHDDHGRCDAPAASDTDADTDADVDADPDADGRTSGEGASGRRCCRVVPDWFGCFGQRPPGRVWIVVPVTTALGLDDAPVQLPGHGWVAAEQARAIITAEGSIWKTMLADLDTGQALRLSRAGYRPSRAMVEHVIAVDGVCRGPGCTVPASQCDIDHDIPYPDGPTDVRLMSGKHRQHHEIRTAGFWIAVRDPNDATIAWRTGAGRNYVTYPTDWFEEARPRPKPVEFDHNPDPVNRPYGPARNPHEQHDPGPPPF